MKKEIASYQFDAKGELVTRTASKLSIFRAPQARRVCKAKKEIRVRPGHRGHAAKPDRKVILVPREKLGLGDYKEKKAI